MPGHLWRHDVAPRRGRRLRLVLHSARETAAIAMASIVIATSPLRADSSETTTAAVDTEHLFGFVEGADIGGQGEKEFVVDQSLRAGRSTGAFDDTASELELKYTAFQNFRISTSGVAGMGDTRHAAMQSLFFDARFRLLDRDRAPVGLTISAAPHFGFVDETSGVPAGHYGTEAQLLADYAFKPDRLVGAINLLFANDRTRLVPSDGLQHESLVGAGAALAAQIMPGLWLGGEVRYLRDYGGSALDVFAGQALYIGPTVYARLARSAFVSVAWNFQVWGSAAAAPGALDLANFERYQVKLRFGLEF
jgi:hypothetical protein